KGKNTGAGIGNYTMTNESEKNFYEKLGKEIRKQRKNKGYPTIGSLCQELVDYGLDISDDMLRKYEKGTERISVYRLSIIVNALGIKMSDLKL
ncbi:MAG: helix-turn-helix domain-containing protein, partial [Blautia sp.]|nr:helix-turn-helix domain-containing protein [Blautia sp.]